jgi:hypothetical protein
MSGAPDAAAWFARVVYAWNGARQAARRGA